MAASLFFPKSSPKVRGRPNVKLGAIQGNTLKHQAAILAKRVDDQRAEKRPAFEGFSKLSELFSIVSFGQ
jgi:hypothetical protein